MLQLSFIPGLTRRGMWRGQTRACGSPPASAAWHRPRLFGMAIGQCRQRGCGLVQLNSDKRRPAAHRFYEALGFEASHEGYKLPL